MKKIALALYVAVLSTASMAANAAPEAKEGKPRVQTGTIKFTGQIVESPCSTASNGDVTCYRNGKHFTNVKELQEKLYTESIVHIDEKRAVRTFSYN